MRILIANKFMYPRGGDCVVALLTSQLLKEHGHDVRLFAMDYPDNLQVPDAEDYASRVSFDGSIGDKLRAYRRLAGKGDISNSFLKVMRDFRPDVVHLHNIHSYLSPVIGELAAREGARVVWTQHDYKLLCPSYSCRRSDGNNCEECFGGNLSVVRNRCMKGSLAASLIAAREARIWPRKRLEKFTHTFICPSKFMAENLTKAGYPEDKIMVVNNFADPAKFEGYQPKETPSDYFCYIGRLSSEKGIETLVRAAVSANVRLKIAGKGPLERELKEKYGDTEGIEFLGHLDAKGVAETLVNALASVMPSECYENNPLGVIESLCLGTPVIGAEIGGIPELLLPTDKGDKSGATFPSGDAKKLAELLSNFEARDYNRKGIAEYARKEFSPDRHYERLMKIYAPD